MDAKISKALEGAIARTLFDMAKSGAKVAHKDFLMIQILRDEGLLANQLLASNLKEWELPQICKRIENEITARTSSDMAEIEPEEFFAQYLPYLTVTYNRTQSVSSAYVLLDILGDNSTVASGTLQMYGITAEIIATQINTNPEFAVPSAASAINFADTSDNTDNAQHSGSSRMLSKFGTDLTLLARQGKIDPVVGRDEEIERLIQILSRRKKNNPILIGEAGVGKSAVVEGLALRIASGKAPYTIKGKSIFSLDISALVAGTKFRGEFEERMQQLIEELRQNRDAIIFIDEIHTIVGAGSTQGSLDTANILKPALARGELQTIGATTIDEYRENIEKDAALERRFQKIIIEPTTAEQTLTILRNIAPRYEQHHSVRYSDEALRACVEMSEQYITDRNFPDKAIDILDEAGSRAHIVEATPPKVITQLEQQVQTVRKERAKAVKAAVYDRAAEARLEEIALRSRLGEADREWRRQITANPVEVTSADIAAVITSITGIPAERLSQSEMERLRMLESRLTERVIGQSDAVSRVTRAIKRSRAGLQDANKPIGVFMFVGPTGVGKTLLAKELASYLFGDSRNMTRIDMSEYGEKHNVSRLIGSPPGYVGYGEGGQLTEAVRHRPYSVVLLDEIEKAHPEVFNTMLQIFDEGHLTDGSGRKVDFRNTVIIMTSNVGSRMARERSTKVGYSTSSKSGIEAESNTTEYRKAMERTFAPEFLNRIDDIVVFRELEVEDVERIVDLELHDIFKRTEKLGYSIRITGGAKRNLAAMGYEARYGARALKRTLVVYVEDPLSTLIVDGKLCEGDTVVVERSKDGGVEIKVA